MKLSSIIEKLVLLFVTVLICGLIFEFGIFKYVLKTSDQIPNTSIKNIVRYEPEAKATLYEPDGSSHTVKINANGWNSTKAKYNTEKSPDITRIAVIGDSYVHAAAVNVPEAFAEIIEQDLNKWGLNSEVYRFGIDGAPLSQYLYMLRNEALQFNPDIVIVQLIHNDFDESYRFLYGRYSSSFMKVETKNDKFLEVMPQTYKKGLIDYLKQYRTFRYLYYQTGLALYVRRLINLAKGEDENKEQTVEPKHGFIQSAIDVRNITELDKIRKVTAYIMHRMKMLSEEKGFKLVFAMDAVREAVYTGNPASEYEASVLNKIAFEEAQKLNLHFIDLTKPFAESFKVKQQKFEFPWDWHWNKHGNNIAGLAISNYLKKAAFAQTN